MVAYTHLMEFIPSRESGISGKFMFIDGLVVVVSPLILLTLTKRTADLLMISVILNSLAFVMFLVFRIPESIKFLLEKKRWARAKIEMKKIKFLGSIGEEKY
jgi:hypothetical protein